MDLNKDAYYAFLLLFFFMSVAYFVGLSTDVNYFSAALVKIFYALSGRDLQGHTVGYATGATTVQGG